MKMEGNIMILQNIIWPNTTGSEITELYYHTNNNIIISENNIYLPANTTICFDTYFNSFLAKKWAEYTKIEIVTFEIEVSGKGVVQLIADKDILIEQKEFDGKKKVSFSISIQKYSFYYLKLYSDDSTIIFRGIIKTDMIGRDIRLALVICTYNREKELFKNIEILKEKNKNQVDQKSVLEWIYIIDNARNLKKNLIEEEKIQLFPNPNTGGTGGFTRGMKEAMKENSMTHIILMDDDVQIEFEAFLRTKSFLTYIKKNYEEHFLGGAMFRKDIPYILHAAGENWLDGHIENPYKNTDMRTINEVVKVSENIIENQAYAGWWYCCIPRNYVEKKGYPLPFFIHVDDVEYSLRNGKRPIYLNGIAVWHDEFEDKKSSIIEYYDVRNRLITNSIYKKENRKLNAIYIICERLYANVFRYRYKDFKLSIKAVEDFLKGPEWLFKLDTEMYHKKLMEYGYKMKNVNTISTSCQYPKRNILYILLRYFLPARKKARIRIGAPIIAFAGKKKVLLIDPKNRKGFLVEKSWIETIRCIVEALKIIKKVSLDFSKAEKAWRKQVIKDEKNF